MGVDFENAEDVLCAKFLSQLPQQVIQLGKVEGVFDLLAVSQEESACVHLCDLSWRDRVVFVVIEHDLDLVD